MTKANWLLSQKPQPFKVANPNAAYAIVMIIGGDSDLAPMLGQDLQEMVSGFSEHISNLLLVDFPGITGANVLETTSTGIRRLDQFEELSTGDPEALSAFLARALVSYSAKTRFALGFWGHGQGVYGDDDAGEVLLPAALLKKLSPPRRPRHPRRTQETSAHGMLPDDSSGDVLTNREARSALAVAFARAERMEPIDMVFSDTCLNGSVEVYTELRGFAQTVVASSFLVDGRGWDYRNWMQRTDREMPASAQDWAQGAVTTYEETYPQSSGDVARQLAAFSTSGGGDLVVAFGEVVKAILALKPKPAKRLLEKAIAQTEKIEEVTNLDLRQLVCHLLDLTKDDAVREACSAFLLVFDEAQIGVSEQPYGDYPLGGLTIWCPMGDKDQAGVGAYYPKLEFAKKTKWLKCLKQVFPNIIG